MLLSSIDQVVVMGSAHEYSFIDYIFMEEGVWHSCKYSIEFCHYHGEQYLDLL